MIGGTAPTVPALVPVAPVSAPAAATSGLTRSIAVPREGRCAGAAPGPAGPSAMHAFVAVAPAVLGVNSGRSRPAPPRLSGLTKVSDRATLAITWALVHLRYRGPGP
jgi:hypothetical protein